MTRQQRRIIASFTKARRLAPSLSCRVPTGRFSLSRLSRANRSAARPRCGGGRPHGRSGRSLPAAPCVAGSRARRPATGAGRGGCGSCSPCRGRPSSAGAWWIEPDYNLPSGFALEKQIALCQDYFASRFGIAPKVAYNVDSLGHAASLPRYMTAAGQTSDVMMRPGSHEMTLPSLVFRWREAPGGPAVTTFRVASAYMTRPPLTLGHLRACVTDLPDGVRDTMCFVGVGDHGAITSKTPSAARPPPPPTPTPTPTPSSARPATPRRRRSSTAFAAGLTASRRCVCDG